MGTQNPQRGRKRLSGDTKSDVAGDIGNVRNVRVLQFFKEDSPYMVNFCRGRFSPGLLHRVWLSV